MTAVSQSSTWGELLSGRNGLRSIALSGGVALHAVNVYIVTTILPSVVQDIGGLSYYAWNTTLFIAASIVGSALSSSLLSSLGVRSSFLLAILIFMVGSILAAMSPTMLFMLGARTIQGLGGGLLLGLSYSSVRMVFVERLWPRAMALISSMWGIATLAGPAIGGVFAESGNWRLAFWSIIPVALVIVLLVITQLKSLPESDKQSANSVPLVKILLLAWSVVVISYGRVAQSWLLIALSFIIVLTILYGIARDDQRSKSPLFPEGTYSLRTPLGCLYAGVALMSIGITSEIFVPYFLQVIHEIRPLIAGYMTAVMSAGWTAGSILTASRSSQFANKLFFVGPILSGLSLAVLGILLPLQQLSEWQIVWTLYLPLFGVGFGVGIIWPHLLTRIFKSAKKGQENVASAAIITIQLYAMSIGAAIAGMITNATGFNEGTLAGTQHSAMVLLLSLACVPIVFVFISGPARKVQ